MTFVAGHVQVAYRADAQNLVPAMVFLKHFQHFFLFHYLFQLGRILPVGNAQQQSVVVFHDVEQVDVSRARYQAAVVTVHRIAQLVIVRVELPVSIQQPCLVRHPPFFKQADYFFRVAFRTCIGNVGRNDFLHFLLDALHVVQPDGSVDMQFAEISL